MKTREVNAFVTVIKEYEDLKRKEEMLVTSEYPEEAIDIIKDRYIGLEQDIRIFGFDSPEYDLDNIIVEIRNYVKEGIKKYYTKTYKKTL